jgi:deoxycytidylate deaminase
MFKKDFKDFITKFTKCGVFHCYHKEIDGKGPQVMCCMFCYNNSIDASNLAITQARKKYIYYKTNNGFEKICECKPCYNCSYFQKEVNSIVKGVLKRQPTKKKSPNVSSSAIYKNIRAKNPFKNNDVQQKQFLQNIGLLVVKNFHPIQFEKNAWFRCLVMHLCSRVLFSLRKFFLQVVLPNLV